MVDPFVVLLQDMLQSLGPMNRSRVRLACLLRQVSVDPAFQAHLSAEEVGCLFPYQISRALFFMNLVRYNIASELPI